MKVYYCHACRKSFAAASPVCFYCQGDFVEETPESLSRHMLPTVLTEQNLHRMHTNNANSAAGTDGEMVWSGSIGPSMFTVRSTVRTTQLPSSPPTNPVMTPVINIGDNPLAMVMDFMQAHLPGDPAESILRPLFLALGIPGDPRDYVTDPERYRQVLDHIFTAHQAAAQASSQGMSEAQIEESVESVEQPSGVCAICRDEYAIDASVKELRCGHAFHKDCVVPWLRRVASCPMCRKNPIADAE